MGFTIIERIVVIGITVAVVGLTATAFVGLSNSETLDKDTGLVLTAIEKARNDTINAKNGSEFGVMFSSSTVTIFEGTVYNANAVTNVVYNISTKVTLSSLQLTGGASTIYFGQIDGKPSATGTITYSLKSNASSTKSISIYGSGLAEVQ
jgi:type II secretory pathway pseudopilin PulG